MARSHRLHFAARPEMGRGPSAGTAGTLPVRPVRGTGRRSGVAGTAGEFPSGEPAIETNSTSIMKLTTIRLLAWLFAASLLFPACSSGGGVGGGGQGSVTFAITDGASEEI